MTYKVRNYNGISFLGFGGYMDVVGNYDKRKKEERKILKNVNKRIEKSKKKFETLVKKLRSKSVFIFHYPPKGIFDKISDEKNPYHGKSTGVEFFRKGILKEKPFLVLCGHMHEYQGKKKIGESLVVNPGAVHDGKAAIVDIDEKKGKVKKIEFLR